jgi:SSS family solute:Na+ symporter
LLFATGKLLYGQMEIGFGLLVIFIACTSGIVAMRKKLF